jgi:HK97 family phage portal protein
MADTRRPSLYARVKAGLMGIGPWSSRPGPYSSPAALTDEGWIPFAWPINFGQVGYDPIPSGWNSVVYACIMLYARTIAQLPGKHNKVLENNGTEQIKTSALARILMKPNGYQTPSDFMQNMVASYFADGNAYALGLRNDRFEVSSLHQMPSRSCRALYSVNQDGGIGDVFYSIGGNPLVHFTDDPAYISGQRIIVPQRDILHFCGPAKPEDPLRGESPLVAGVGPIAVSSGAGAHYARFYQNMSRPSGVLSTDQILTVDQVKELRTRWEAQTTGIGIGGVPILTSGLKWEAMALSASDMQIAESMKMSKQDIAMIFGIPLALINDMTGATWNNTENLIAMWKTQGLGFHLDHIERAYDKLFGIGNRFDEYTWLDLDEALMRPDFKTRMDALKSAVQGGIYAPNEARKLEGLPKAKDGDEPRVQQQVVPLSFNAKPPEPAPAPAPAPANDDDEPDDGEEEDDEDAAAAKMWERGETRQFVASRANDQSL